MQAQNVVSLTSAADKLQDRVFAACDQLWEEKGADFTNQDVLAVSKGGIAAVGALVKVYRANQQVIEANEALGSSVTISLVHSLNDLLEAQTVRSQQAVESFMATTADEMTALADKTEQQQQTIDRQVGEIADLRATIKELEAKNVRHQATEDTLRRDLHDSKQTLVLAQGEITHQAKMHQAKIEQLHSENQTALTRALEAQRQAMRDEYKETMDTQRKEQAGVLAAANDRLEHIRDQNRILEDKNHALYQKLEDVTVESARWEERVTGLDALIEEKQVTIQQAQKESRHLVGSIQQQLALNTEAVNDELRSISSVTESFYCQIENVTTLLNDLQSAAEALRSVERNDQCK